MKRRKKFDCVRMKRQGDAKAQTHITALTAEEQLEYWQEQTLLLRRRQEELRRGHDTRAA
jgi:hypothetical protein